MPKSARIIIDHRVAELEGINFKLLNSKKKLLQAAANITEALQLTVVNSFVHRFKPHGISLVLVISQSHLAIHTWPEFGYLHMDVLSCSQNTRLEKLAEVLKKEFSPTKIRTREISY
ncbi:MAG: adenosylmethionine decarboxylase [bacterium]|nr:adenosylmethionine decarboxylase [bacterium]